MSATPARGRVASGPFALWFGALFCGWLLLGCDDGGTATPCTPGQTTPCTCEDGANGAQTCAASGAAFEACVCAPDEDDATADADAPADGAVEPDAALDPDAAAPDVGPDAAAPDAAGPDAAVAECGPDAPCPGQQACEDGACVEPAACAEDVDCIAERLCVQGRCAAPCAGDDGCPGTRVCVDARCVESERCFDPADCDPGRVCVDGACDDACGAQRPCPDGQVCSEDGRCGEDPDGCADDAGCLGARLCVNGACVDPCAEDAACPGNRLCVDGRCPEADPCLVPLDCDADRACVDGTCQPTCEFGGAACPEGLICDDDLGACRPDDRCRDDAACPAGQHCADGRCLAECVEGADCPGNRPCDAERGRCLEADPCFGPDDCDAGRSCEDFRCVSVCAGDADCPGAQTCVDDRCAEPARCAGDVDCLGDRRCQGGVCDAACAGDADCDGTQVCDAGRCVAEGACGGDVDCPGIERCTAGRCALPECEVGADCPSGICVDTVCAEVPPFACGEDAPCRVGQICAPAAVCVPDGTCEEDAQCPRRAPACDDIGRCVECVAAFQCFDSERCEDNRCVPDTPCAADRECPGTQVCRDGACLPTDDCVDDRLGDARPPITLAARVHGGLTWCDGTLDRFRVVAPAGEGRIIAVRHDAAVGDLALELTAAGEPARILGVDDGPYGYDRLVLPPGDAEQAVDVRVTGRAGFDVPYAIEVQPLGADDCPPDAFEGPLGNDIAEHATPLTDAVEAIDVALCPEDADWFALFSTLGVDWRIRAVPDDAGPVALRLLDPDGVEVAVGDVLDGDTVLNHAPEMGGLYRLGLDGPATPVALSFAREVGDDAAERACAAPPTLRPGQPLALRPVLDRFEVSCGDGADAVATFDLATPTRVDVELFGSTDPLGSAVALRRSCDGVDLTCSAAGEWIRSALLPAGRYFVVAKMPPGETAQLQLVVRDHCTIDPECGGGQQCVEGLCVQFCIDDAACPGDQTCVDNACAAPAVCAGDADCPGLSACDGGACVRIECLADTDCPGFCVDWRCVDALPGACGPDAPCADALVCLPIGACVPDGPCAADADCPVGAPRCGAGACARCLEDADCEGQSFCEGGACVSLGFCFGPEDCPGDQVCGADGQCAPAPCPGDRFDDLPLADRPPVLDVRTYGELVRCDGATDTYRVLPGPDEGVEIVLRHRPDDGDLRLRLTDDLGRTVEADTPYGVERLALGAGAARVDIEVDGTAGRSTPYALSVTRLDPGVCAADPGEGLTDNDAPERATVTDPGEAVLGVCPGDLDHYALELDAGTRLVVDAVWDQGGDGVALDLLDPEGEVTPGQVLDGGDLRLDTVVTDGGRHLVRLSGGEASAEGRLSLLAVGAENGAELACADAPTLVPGVAHPLPRRAPVDRFTLGCGQGRETEYVAAFDLAAPGTVDVILEGDPAGVAYGIRSACADDGSEVICRERRMEGVELDAGRWFVVVETGPTIGPPALRVEVR